MVPVATTNAMAMAEMLGNNLLHVEYHFPVFANARDDVHLVSSEGLALEVQLRRVAVPLRMRMSLVTKRQVKLL